MYDYLRMEAIAATEPAVVASPPSSPSVISLVGGHEAVQAASQPAGEEKPRRQRVRRMRGGE